MHTLEAVLRWLCDLESRLQYTAPPLRDYFRETAAAPAYRELSFLETVAHLLQQRDFCEAWETAVSVHAPADGLDAADRQLLLGLGSRLGVSDADSQIRSLQETARLLSEHRETALEKRRKADRLYAILGAAGGLAVAVLMM